MNHQCLECHQPLNDTAISGMCLECYIQQIQLALLELNEIVSGHTCSIRNSMEKVLLATRK